MKRNLFTLLTGVCILFGVLFVGCSDGSSNNDEKPDVQQTLQQRISSAEAGAIINLGAENLRIDAGASYTINKALTLTNGNVKNATFVVESTGVTLENITGISSVIVDEKVEDGDFTLTNCRDVGDVYVNGGGENSIHISQTTVKKIAVQKNGVRINLQGAGASIERAFIFEDCKLESEESNSTFVCVVIAETVEKLELAGSAAVEKLVSVSQTVTVTITVSQTVTITAASEAVIENIKTNNTSYTAKIEKAELSAEEKQEMEAVKAEATASKLNFYVEGGEDKESTDPKIAEKTDDMTYAEKIDGLTIEKNSSEIIVTNENADSIEKIWNYTLKPVFSIGAKAGKNYRISFDMRAETESYVMLQAKNNSISPIIGSNVPCKVGTEYQTFSVLTGTAVQDWKDGSIYLGIGSVSKLFIKNYKIEEISGPMNFTFSYWSDNSADYYDSVMKGTVENGNVAKLSFKECAGGAGIDVMPMNILLDIGKMYAFSFDVTSDVDIAPGEIAIWVHGCADFKDTAGSSLFSFAANEKKTLTVYVPVYPASETNKNGDKHYIPTIWIGMAKKVCNLTVENVSVKETDIEAIRAEHSELDIYFATWINNEWVVFDKNQTVPVNAHTENDGQFILCDSDAWSSTVNPVTSFRVLGRNNTALQAAFEKKYVERDKFTDVRLFFSNDTDETKYIKFSLDDTYKVVLDKGSVDDVDGFYGNSAYLVNTSCMFNWYRREELYTGKWYKATYTVESSRKRNEADEERAEISTGIQTADGNTNLKTTRIQLSSEPQIIEHVFCLPDCTWLYSCVSGSNTIVKFSSYSIEETAERE